MREEAEDAEPVIDVHHHDAMAGEDFTVEQSFHSRSGGVSSTVDPDHDGDARCLGHFGVHTFSCRQSSLWGSCLLSF